MMSVTRLAAQGEHRICRQPSMTSPAPSSPAPDHAASGDPLLRELRQSALLLALMLIVCGLAVTADRLLAMLG